MTRPTVISVSSLKNISCCPRARSFRFGCWVKRRTSRPYFALGSAMHVFLADHYSGVDEDTAEKHAIEDFNQKKPDDITLEDEKEALQKLDQMIDFYMDGADENSGVFQDEMEGLTPLAAEQRFSIPCGPAYFVGVVDLVCISHGRMTIKDHKTAGACGPAYFRNYAWDPQGIFYPIAAQHLKIEVESFAVNVITKTKQPRCEREAFPINNSRLSWAWENLLKTMEEMETTMAHTVEEALELPAYPTECRYCPYLPICEAPSIAKHIVASDYTIGDYSDFGIETPQ